MITRFDLVGFRNLKEQSIHFDAPFCFITGDNGSGKTSLLEAIYVSLNGKSFRTSKTKHIVSHTQDQLSSYEGNFVLRTEFEVDSSVDHSQRYTVAIKKSVTDKYLAKVNGHPVSAISELAQALPSLIVEPKTFNLFSGGAISRRRLLDWIVFHVEPQFSNAWKSYNAVLKQRNSLLRTDRIDQLTLGPWDAQLAKYGDQLHHWRQQSWAKLQTYFDKYAEGLLSEDIRAKISTSYRSGWPASDGSMLNALTEHASRDITKGFTQIGAHRADLRFTFKGLPIEEGLSRGQQKLLVLALFLSAVSLVREIAGKQTLLLLDDIAAEIDEANLARLFRLFASQDARIIASGLDDALFLRAFNIAQLEQRNVKMFHVEHGKLEQTNLT